MRREPKLNSNATNSADGSRAELELVYTLLCDDVRLEVGNKLSYMGVFQSIIVPQLPVWLPKLAVVNHWRGNGATFQKSEFSCRSAAGAGRLTAGAFEINQGAADNISFFVNVTFPVRESTGCRLWWIRLC